MVNLQNNHSQSELTVLRKAVEASGEVIFMTDREGTITYINPEFTRLYGYTGDEVVGKSTPRILKSGVMKQEDYERFWASLLNKEVVKREFFNKCRDGSIVHVESSANPILDEDENIIGFLAIQRDITQRKQAEQALEEAHTFQQMIVDGIGHSIMVIESDFQVIMANKAAQDFSYGGVELARPMFCYQMSHRQEVPCDGIEHPCPLQQVRETGQPVTVIHQHYQVDGEQRFVEVVASPFKNPDGLIQGIIESMRDITEYKQAEEASLKYADRLRALAAQLAEVEDKERQRLARELHDRVGQNLTALGINLNIVQMQMPESAPETISFHLDDSLSLVEQTAERIRDVMADLRPPVLDDYGLVAALRWYGEKFSRRINIPIIVQGEEPDPRLDTRIESALFRIAQEALTNVAKHARATQVIITVESDVDNLRLIVSDDGIGFDPRHLSESNEDQGWGLISITERAESVGADFKIESAPKHGTTVFIEVPR
jgi:PAS domain S-box-containing protein